MPANGTIYVGRDATVGGVIKGEVTVAADRDILIGTDILSNHSNNGINDTLLLVADKDVRVTRSTPGDLSIYAYIIALNGSFKVDNYKTLSKSNLWVWGIMNDKSGPISKGSTGYRLTTGSAGRFTLLEIQPPTYIPPLRDALGRIRYNRVNFREL
jgi:hypothetical protein